MRTAPSPVPALRMNGRTFVSSKALKPPIAGIGNLKERIELRQLEQRLEIVVQIGQTKLTALLANLLRERHQDTKAGAVDVAGLRKVDEKFLLAFLHLVEDLLLQLLAIADDQLALDVHDNDISFSLDRET